MRSWMRRKFGLVAVVLASTFAACNESPTAIPEPPQSLLGIDLDLDLGLGSDESGPRPLKCFTFETSIGAEIITPLGGVVTAAGSRIRLPENAVSLPTLITLIVPASRFMEINLTANDLAHFLFNEPVRVAIDYSRCPAWRIDRGPLSVWYWNPLTQELIENMNAVDHRDQQRIVFRTDHFSGFVIAN